MRIWTEVAAVVVAFSLLLVCQPAFPMNAEKALTQEKVETIPGRPAIELQKSVLLKMEVIDSKNNYVEVAPPKKTVELTRIEKIAQDLDNYLMDIKTGRIRYADPQYTDKPVSDEQLLKMVEREISLGRSKKEESVNELRESVRKRQEKEQEKYNDLLNRKPAEIPYYYFPKDEPLKEPVKQLQIPENFKVINREKAKNDTSSIIQKEVIITKEPVKTISVPEKFKVINREKVENGTSCVIQKEVIITKVPEKKVERPDIRRLNRSIPMFNQFNIENKSDDKLMLK